MPDDIQQPGSANVSRRQTRLEPGERFAGFRIVHHIDRGSYGDVYRATVWGDDVIASEVALKIPYEQDIDSTKLRLEAELWVACSEHQNIVRLLSAGVADGLFYMASEFIRGGTLRNRLSLNPGKPQVSQPAAVDITRGMLAALGHLHSPRGDGMHGVIHRDLKPENILMTGNTPKLTDFGVSAALTSTRGVRTGAGTFAYRAPEDFSDRTDARSDLWAAGVILYEMLSGRLPFYQHNNDAATMSAIMHKTAPPLPQCVPEPIVSVVTKALAKDPDDRFHSAAEMRDALEEAVDGLRGVLRRQPVCVVDVGARCCCEVPPEAAQTPLEAALEAATATLPKVSAAPAPVPDRIQRAAPASRPARQVVPTVADPPPKRLVPAVPEQALQTPQREAPNLAPNPRESVGERAPWTRQPSFDTPQSPAPNGRPGSWTRALFAALVVLLAAGLAIRGFIPPATKINHADGAEMVYVPAGEFAMGDDNPPSGDEDEKPSHKVYLDGYYIYKNPVTVAQYEEFCTATGRAMPPAPRWGWDNPDYPIVNVSWNDANAYAKWAGVSLPTEAQWEKAARGTDGRQYPWGNTWDPSECANSVSERRSSPAAVGSFPSGASPFGALDMAGNVWQWCSDWYDPKYYGTSPERNPTGPASSPFGYRVLRGGSWYYCNTGDYFRCAFRTSYDPDVGDDDVNGFRCVARQN